MSKIVKGKNDHDERRGSLICDEKTKIKTTQIKTNDF